MNAAVGVRTPAAVLAGIGRGRTRKTFVSRFLKALKESRRREARLVIARNVHLLPSGHAWRNGPH